jgi:hypothetical protein
MEAKTVIGPNEILIRVEITPRVTGSKKQIKKSVSLF